MALSSDGTTRRHWTTTLGEAASQPGAFLIVVAYGIVWIMFDRSSFDFHAVATLIVWIMTLFIERSGRRDTLAIHAKIDELLRADSNARSELATLDDQEPEAIANHRDAEVQAMDDGCLAPQPESTATPRKELEPGGASSKGL